MNSRRYGRSVATTVAVLSFLVAIVAFFPLIQQGPLSNALAQVVIPAEDALANFHTLPKKPHPACPDCFTIAQKDRYEIFEEIAGTGIIIAREIPNPAPLKPDERRLEFDPETGLPIWYIGRQPYVGPTDEEPFSPEFPVPKIVLQRIQARHRVEIFSIPGVRAFGIGGKGLLVFLDPKYAAVATIAHISLGHSEPASGHTSPPSSSEPIRRLYYGPSSSVNGPIGDSPNSVYEH